MDLIFSLQPIIKKDDYKRLNAFQIEMMHSHILYNILMEQVFASGASTFAVVSGGHKVYVCGSGAYGHPHERNPTGWDRLHKAALDTGSASAENNMHWIVKYYKSFMHDKKLHKRKCTLL